MYISIEATIKNPKMLRFVLDHLKSEKIYLLLYVICVKDDVDNKVCSLLILDPRNKW